jgi:hypothetical protein
LPGVGFEKLTPRVVERLIVSVVRIAPDISRA